MRIVRHWECDYAHDRRKHRHRCRVCAKVITAGERVMMAKVANRKTYAMHIEHAEEIVQPGQAGTWRQSFEAWGKGVDR